jgi:hypothetical protein
MKKMFTLASVLTASLMFSNGLAFAQKSARPKGKISVAEILDKHVSAMGGTDKLRTLHSFHARGVFGLMPMTPIHALGDFHFYYKTPGSDVFQLDVPSHGQSSIGHNEGMTFSRGSVNGLRGVNGVTLAVEFPLGVREQKKAKRDTE